MSYCLQEMICLKVLKTNKNNNNKKHKKTKNNSNDTPTSYKYKLGYVTCGSTAFQKDWLWRPECSEGLGPTLNAVVPHVS